MSFMVPSVTFGDWAILDCDSDGGNAYHDLSGPELAVLVASGLPVEPGRVLSYDAAELQEDYPEAFALLCSRLNGGDEPDYPDAVFQIGQGCYKAMLSAPGYLDRTDATLHTELMEAGAYLFDTYDEVHAAPMVIMMDAAQDGKLIAVTTNDCELDDLRVLTEFHFIVDEKAKTLRFWADNLAAVTVDFENIPTQPEQSSNHPELEGFCFRDDIGAEVELFFLQVITTVNYQHYLSTPGG